MSTKAKGNAEWLAAVGRRLQALRKSLSLSTKQVANALGITDAGYRNWEGALAAPPSRRLCALADIFGTSVEFILSGSHATSSDFCSVKRAWEERGCRVEEKLDKTISLTLLFPVTVNAVGDVALHGANALKTVVNAQKELNFTSRAQFLAYSHRLFEKTKNYLLAEALNDDAV